MSKSEYQFIESPLTVNRRQFIGISALTIAALAAPTFWFKSVLYSRHNYIEARIAGLYKDDEKSKIRVSHKNPAVAKYYADFGGTPTGELSERLLHTHYIDRTKNLAA